MKRTKPKESVNLIDQITTKSRELQEFFHTAPELKEKVLNMVKSFPNLPNSIEDMLLYYLKTLEYYELYSLDPFDSRLERVDQKLEDLSRKLGLQYETSKSVKLKARQLLAYA